MGPRPFSRGDMAKREGMLPGEYMLQWGRDLSVAETEIKMPMSVSAHQASMGPRPFSRGDLPDLHTPLGVEHASMGPRPFSRGDVCRAGHCVHVYGASMGPRPFSRGDGPRLSPENPV